MKAVGRILLLLLCSSALLVACHDKETDPQPSHTEDTITDTTSHDTTLNVLPRLSVVEHYYYDITHKYENAQRQTLVEADTAITHTTERWHWQGDTLTSIDYYENGAPHHTVAFLPTPYGHLRTDSRYPADTAYFYLTDSRPDSIFEYSNATLTWSCHITYSDGGKATALVRYYQYGAELSRTEYSFEIADGDIIKMTYEDRGIFTENTFSYSSLPNPYYMTDRSLSYLNLSRHIALSQLHRGYDSSTMELQAEEQQDYHYTINGNSPSALDTRRESFVGKYHNIYIHHYDYTYF